MRKCIYSATRQGSVVGRVVIALLLVLVITAVVWVGWSKLPAAAVEEAILQPGDILFVDLYRGWCQSGYWDHMAIYTGRGGVVEATYNAGVCLTPLRSFLRRDAPASVSIRRLDGDIGNRDVVIEEAVAYAMTEVGRPFDFSATATIPLKMNEQNVHCAEVVWRAYKAAGIDLDGNNGPFLYPDDIYYCPRLEAV